LDFGSQAAGTYTVSAVEASTGCSSTMNGSATVSVHSLPALTITSQPAAVCAPNTVDLTTAVLSQNTNLSYYQSDGTTPLATPNAVAAGTYQVTYTDGNSCESAPVALTAVVKALPEIAVVSYTNACAGGTIEVNVTEIAGAVYTWTGAAGTGSLTHIGQIANVMAATRYQGTVTAEADGCVSAALNYDVVSRIAPEVTRVTSAPVCPGEVITFTATATDAVSYQWTGDVNASATATATTAAVVSGQTYAGQVVAVSAENCQSAPFDFTQTAYETPGIPQLTVNNGCNLPVRFTIDNFDNDANYRWELDGVQIANPGAVFQVNTPVEGQTYQMSVVAQKNGCPSPAAIGQQQYMSSPAKPILTTNDGCGNDVRFTISAYDASLQYNWEINGQPVTVSGSTYQVPNPQDGVTYLASVTAVRYNLCASTEWSGGQTYKIAPVVVLKQVSPVCSPAIIQMEEVIDWTQTSAATVQFYNPDQTINTGAMTADVGTYTYYVRGFSDSQCPSAMIPFELTINELSLLYKKEMFLCYGDEVEVSVQALGPQAADYQYSFVDESGVAPRGTITDSEASWVLAPEHNVRYALTVSNGACTERSDIQLEVSPLPEVQVGQSNPREATIEPLSTHYTPYSYYLDGSDALLEQLVFEVAPGDHSLRVVDVNGCESTWQFNIDKSMYQLEIPHFFSPDNDGVNDTWEIGNIEHYPNAEIKIFDRFHKLVAEYRGSDSGWDGTYRGHPLVSTDYWYWISIPALGKPVSGHITLFRGRKD
ncbi:MAG: T9SS type B sorting domain-containing protein, partial [Paludibacteraceae bacterium]|nr:T9SS type B sorting domain-containing protein [Paludibacteraceae bacterium]